MSVLLYTNDCNSHSQSVRMFQFSDNSTVMALISYKGRIANGSEISFLVNWYEANNLELIVSQTKETLVDFYRSCGVHLHLVINNTEMRQPEIPASDHLLHIQMGGKHQY